MNFNSLKALIVQNGSVHNGEASEYMEQELIKIQKEVHKTTITVRSLSIMVEHRREVSKDNQTSIN